MTKSTPISLKKTVRNQLRKKNSNKEVLTVITARVRRTSAHRDSRVDVISISL
jgi:hypothetical protein